MHSETYVSSEFNIHIIHKHHNARNVTQAHHMISELIIGMKYHTSWAQ